MMHRTLLVFVLCSIVSPTVVHSAGECIHVNASRPIGVEPVITELPPLQSTLGGRSGASDSAAFDGRYIWCAPMSAQHTPVGRLFVMRMDTRDASLTAFDFPPTIDAPLTNTYQAAVYDNHGGVWLAPTSVGGYIVKVNTADGSMTAHGNSIPGRSGAIPTPDGAYFEGFFDGQNVWFSPQLFDAFTLIDYRSGNTTAVWSWPAGYDPKDDPRNIKFAGVAYDGSRAWLAPYDTKALISVNPVNKKMVAYVNWPAGFKKTIAAFCSPTVAQRSVWLAPRDASHIIRFDMVTETMTGYDAWPSGYSPGNDPVGFGYRGFASSAFDGEAMWFTPGGGNQIVRLDPTTGKMRGYNNNGTLKLAHFSHSGGTVFDGKSLWLLPFAANHFVNVMGEGECPYPQPHQFTPNDTHHGLSSVAIAGIAICPLVVITGAILLLVFRRRQSRDPHGATAPLLKDDAKGDPFTINEESEEAITIRRSPESDSPKKELSDENGVWLSTPLFSMPLSADASSSSTPSSPTTKSYDPKEKVPIKKGKLLGKGAFGAVYQGMDVRGGRLIAVKEMPLSSDADIADVKEIQREVEVNVKLPNHENCVKYLGILRTREHIYILMEYVSGGSIASLLKSVGSFHESTVRNYALSVLRGLKHLHDNDIVHRDIKGANVLIDEQSVAKIADFGCSRDLAAKNTATMASIGTPLWMAPEVCRAQAATAKSDIWSFGCLLIEMASESHKPWTFGRGMSPLQILYAIAHAERPPPVPEHLSAECCDFIESCVRIQPEDRLSVDELLQHSFLTRPYADEQGFKGVIGERTSNELGDSLVNSATTAGDASVAFTGIQRSELGDCASDGAGSEGERVEAAFQPPGS